MKKLQVNSSAPDFTLSDFAGNSFQLSQYKNLNNVYLVLNRSLK